MIRLVLSVLLALAAPAAAADLRERPDAGRFRATCEDLGRFCTATACGRDQIEAAQGCRALCPGAAVLTVAPAACPLPGVVLRRRG
ncbi:hypothetical protein MKK70_12065 [Methylobacterium sp. E-041]|uniref:hypothetical protein n=1 Tax=Methylobacterium sp. E-041 TaxID=2836573 RepID=UPI001FB90995|nr:hypothetical protein [Methylobacterium sp. E-041]MCJ2106098.1 hypothetical protein [Methylobacterium sp. E-041]